MKSAEEIIPLVANSTERVVSVISRNSALSDLLLGKGNFATTVVERDGERIFYEPSQADDIDVTKTYKLSAAIFLRLIDADTSGENREKLTLAWSAIFGPVSLFLGLWKFAEVLQTSDAWLGILDGDKWVVCEYSGKIAFVLEITGTRFTAFADLDCIEELTKTLQPEIRKNAARQIADTLISLLDFCQGSLAKE